MKTRERDATISGFALSRRLKTTVLFFVPLGFWLARGILLSAAGVSGPLIRLVSLRQAVVVAGKNSPFLNPSVAALYKSQLQLDSAKSQNSPAISLSARFFDDVFNKAAPRIVPNLDIQYDLLAFIKNKYTIRYYEKLADLSEISLEAKKTVLTVLLYQEFLHFDFLRSVVRETSLLRGALSRDLENLRIQRKNDLIPESQLGDWTAVFDRCDLSLRLAEQNIRNLLQRLRLLLGVEDIVFPLIGPIDTAEIEEFNKRDFASDLGQKKLDALRMVLQGARMPVLPSVQIATYSVLPYNKELNFFSGFWVSIGISYPLFNRGEHRRNEALAASELKTAEREYAGAQKKREESIAEARQNVDRLSRQTKSLDGEIEALENKLREYGLLSDESLLFDENRERLRLETEEKKISRLQAGHELCLAQLEYIMKKTLPADEAWTNR